MKSSIVAATLSLMTASLVAASGGDSVKWGYAGPEGPHNWGRLAPEFEICESGKNQSPIDLTGFIEADLPPIQFNYDTLSTEIVYDRRASEVVNTGHSLQTDDVGGASIEVSGQVFELRQFHFHTPSENQIEGKSFAMEAHLVHEGPNRSLAVVAVLFEAGEENPAIAKLWAQMPRKAGDRQTMPGRFSASELLPANKDYYRFNGSLTTPPCTEGVWWFVMKEPLTVSQAQVDSFLEVMHHENNRPVRPVNARPILQ
jgi:carbonic anhydrase